MRILYGAAVFEELINISAYIAFENEPSAQRFLDSCNETFQFLAQNQHVRVTKHFHNAELQEVRMWRVKGFEKYLIFYSPISNGVEILHVVHSARDYKTLFEDEQ